MARFDLTAFGESMLRLSPPLGETLETATRFDVHIAGAEGNVLCALAQLGFSCGWSGVLPNSPLGRRVRRTYQSCGVSVAAIDGGTESRLGTYFLQLSPPPFSAQAFYDRRHSAAACAAADVWNWEFLLDTRALHLTSITTALSAANCSAVQTAIAYARKRGIIIGFDVNYRRLLWDAETARKTLLPLLADVDVVFCSRRDAEHVFGCIGNDTAAVLTQFAELTGAQRVVMSDGDSGVCAREDNDARTFSVPKTTIVDRVGCGDAFAAGVWSGILKDDDFFGGIKSGIALAARALTQSGDITIVAPGENTVLPTPDIIR